MELLASAYGTCQGARVRQTEIELVRVHSSRALILLGHGPNRHPLLRPLGCPFQQVHPFMLPDGTVIGTIAVAGVNTVGRPALQLRVRDRLEAYKISFRYAALCTVKSQFCSMK
jgi:hypothetical protein